jgi:FMN phosphatase YigB (HAD superfamily)/DNA-binding XRE family transcriptional regulator
MSDNGGGQLDVQQSSELLLGARLQEARKNAHLTQQELCQRASLSYSTLAKIERGAIKSPSIFTIQSIAEALDTTLNDLMGMMGSAGLKTAKKRSKSGVSFIYFDINGCLVRFYHRAFGLIARDSGKQPDVIETTFWHYNDAVCRGELSIDEFNEILGGQLELDEFDWRAYYLQAVEAISEMHALLRWASENYRVGLLSNIMPGQIPVMIEQGLLPQLDYSAIVDSSEVHAIKPEPLIYEIATEMAQAPTGEILLIDDSRANVMAAEHAGWKVVWFDDYRPDESAERVRDILEIAE